MRDLRLGRVLDGLPVQSLSERAARGLTRLALDMDALGRIDADGTPTVDDHILTALLRDLADDRLARKLTTVLRGLPDPALRPAHIHGEIPMEAPWCALANRVVVLDAEPGRTFGDLHLEPGALSGEAMRAVREAFPGLELELLDPLRLPARLHAASRDGELPALCAQVDRQLGWWAALVGVLLAALAALAISEPPGGTGAPDSPAIFWPLAMYLIATGVGAWTLTVVAGCLLAPAD
jgi:hypothetical protein